MFENVRECMSLDIRMIPDQVFWGALYIRLMCLFGFVFETDSRFLSVQKEVLPKHGFEGSPKGAVG